MTKKKTQEIKNPQYRVKIVPMYEPTKWQAGKWVTENKKPVYTGQPIDKLIGYQICIALVEDESEFLVQPWPFGFENQKMFDTPEEAQNHLDHYGSELKVGNMFKPFSNTYQIGEIVE